MSIALQRGGGGRGGIGGRRRAAGCFPIYDPSPALIAPAEGRRFVQPPPPAAAADEGLDSDTSSSSSIGRNSDGEGVEEGEVQSTYKGPLETMDALEETLPIRRGISNFYCGKSKSFTTLADAVSASSVKDIAKPENPYSRKRKNLFALSSTMRDRARSHDNLLKSIEGGTTGFAKRPANSSRSTFTITASTSSSGSNSSGSEEEHEPVRRLPPLHPRSKPAAAAAAPQSGSSPDEKLPLSVRSRSLSLADLRGLPTTGASD